MGKGGAAKGVEVARFEEPSCAGERGRGGRRGDFLSKAVEDGEDFAKVKAPEDKIPILRFGNAKG